MIMKYKYITQRETNRVYSRGYSGRNAHLKNCTTLKTKAISYPSSWSLATGTVGLIYGYLFRCILILVHPVVE